MSPVERRVLPGVRGTKAQLVDGVGDVDLVSREGGEVVRVAHGPVPGFAVLSFFFLGGFKRERRREGEEEVKVVIFFFFSIFSLPALVQFSTLFSFSLFL